MALVDMELYNLNWNSTEYKLKFVLDNPNFELPQVVRVVQGHMVDEDNSLASGQILTLHGKKAVEKLIGNDSYNKEVSIPFDCPYLVKLISHGEPQKFVSVYEICFNEKLPAFVRAQDELLTGENKKYEANTVFQIIDHVIGDSGDVIGISCMEEKSHDTIILPVNLKCDFIECISPDLACKRYLLSELVGEHELPLQVQFLPVTDRNSGYGPHLGVLSLSRQQSTSAILATTFIDGVRHALTFSTELPVTIQVATSTEDHSNIPSEYLLKDSIDITKFDFLTKSDPYSSAAFQDEICDPPTFSNVLPLPPRTNRHQSYEYPRPNTTFTQQSHKPLRPDKAERKKRTKSLEISKDLKDFEFFCKAKLGLKGLKKSMSKFAKDRRPPRLQNGNGLHCSDFTTRMFDIDASIPDSFSSKSGSTCSEHFDRVTPSIDALSLDTHSAAHIKDRLSRISSKDSGICLRRRKHDRSHSRSTTDARSSSIPSESTFDSNSEWSIPFNYKSVSNNHTKATPSKCSSVTNYLWSADDKNEESNDNNNRLSYLPENTYENDSIIDEPTSVPLTASQVASMKEIKKLNEDGVGSILDVLCLTDFKEIFRDNQINGELLVDLVEEDLVNELKVSLFQAKKIIKYIKGWRPETEDKTNDHQSRRNSLNPRDWSEYDVLTHLNTINLPDLGRFCRSNQVNGDLLLDILDSDSVECLRRDHDVKISCIDAKKLMKFVVKGWRPDSSPITHT